VQSIYERSCADHIPVKRVAFVDRRPTVEQQEHPWHLGEIIEIETVLLNGKIVE